MKILAWEHRKSDGEYYDISTPEKELASYLLLFKDILDSGFYSELSDPEEPEHLTVCEPCANNLHKYCVEENCICEGTADCKKRARRIKSQIDRFSDQRDLFEKAKTGDSKAARELIKIRTSYDYENVRIIHVRDPLEG